MELRTLASFLAVAREGNVTHAARTLHLSQPALSRQLHDLEREFGCDLFVRESRGVVLTEEGKRLRKRAEEIFELVERTTEEVRTESAEVAGDVWVGGGESRSMEVIAQAAAHLRQIHPNVRIRLFSGNGNDVMDRIDRGLLDFGIIMGQRLSGNYETLELPWQDRWGLLMRKDHPLAQRDILTREDLASTPLIVSSQSQTMRSTASVDETLRDLNVVATYTLLYNASLLVEAHVGCAVCFDGIIDAGPSSPFAYVPITGFEDVRSHLVWKKTELPRAATAFLQVLRDNLANSTDEMHT